MFHLDVTKSMKKPRRSVDPLIVPSSDAIALARDEARASLSLLMNKIFTVHPELHYIQGYHDICSVFLLVCGDDMAFRLVERLSLLHIRDALRPNLDTVVAVINLIFPL